MSYDPIQRAIDIQLGGVFSDRPHNPENLIIRFIDLKHFRRENLDDIIMNYALQGYTQKEISSFIGYSERHIRRRMSAFREKMSCI